ncbi:AraC family transcriptional regulator [Chitinophaga niastensis]|uniref:AraC family transcriptional regulator n=1 Tax=Chitinophaga niastensis TaxID=536980 RepID=A0A2P8HJI1_CHINA|nr:helix-turn-helix domain-containing protein [Chitinophaga niastensis]PSL46373.1 AraC family transcriptional regulator [Chitinophaga niastensis]
MKYQELSPPDYLKNHIRYFWTLESTSVDHLPKTFGPMADGCPGLMFQRSEEGTFYQHNKQLPDILLYGQTTKYTALQLIGQVSTIGICCYPNALKSIFGLNADELTNTCVDLNLLPAAPSFRLSEKLMTAASTADQIEIISSFLYIQIKKNQAPTDEITQYALSQIIQSKGNIGLKELQKNLQLTERSFERRFKQCVGISPKLFSRICRFQSSLDQLRNNDYNKLSDIAFENDYADQSHYIRVFKEFAGISPFQYQKQSKEAGTNFSLITK